jgi:threonine dehydratase
LEQIPSKEDIVQAAILINPHVHQTPVMTNLTFNMMLNSNLYFKCENFQKVGAFKSRGAVNAVFSLSDEVVKKGVATHSSGNHAQALARAARLKKIPAYIVMPENAPSVKVEAVKAYGGIITFCKPTLESREKTLAEVIEKTGATEIHPYDNYKVIEGQASCAKELIEEISNLDIILCPVGGGGLLSGTALSTHYFSHNTKVIACEPAGADDAYRSFNSGELIPSIEPKTIADGLLTSLGKRNFPIIQKYVSDVVTVSEAAILNAMKLIFERMKVVVEPSAAVPFAALLEKKIKVDNKRVGIILSGGNIDLTKISFD